MGPDGTLTWAEIVFGAACWIGGIFLWSAFVNWFIGQTSNPRDNVFDPEEQADSFEAKQSEKDG